MIVEVLAVGTELLIGQIVNGNAETIGRRLAEEGHDAHHQGVVGDNIGRIAEAISIALSRADAVIITGGLGPTQDDLTREGICLATGRPMEFVQDAADRLRDRFERLGRSMAEANLRQAERPEGAEFLPNPKGTAPGIALRHGRGWIFSLPGVPEEMEALLETEVLPRLRSGGGAVVKSRLIRTWGSSESMVAELLDDLYGSSNPSIAFLASSGEIKVRITAKASTEADADEMIEPIERSVRERLGTRVFGVDQETIEAIVLRLLAQRGWRLATAESATGGMIAARITSVSGSSKVFRGGAVTYATDLKMSVLDVPADIIEREGVVSEATARAMAEGAAERFGAEVGVSVTGSAGPDPQERQAGTMIIGVHTPSGTRARTMRFPGDRERVRTYTTTAALHLLRLGVTGAWW
ncbi:MAG: competence/damage-inducible protein A [Acidimicrobiia bacterium]